ncbi:MAG: 3-deoxy-manno-octulosonate cytidylyltransferase [Bacteroidales bacterium]|nr:3-deoxy-manno-octulosonate cytidylyltransferase [Bacteroidales bacterium]
MKVVGIIPARYASTRFPGKPLADIAGKTMIQRVYEQSKKALDYVFVATDDKRIAREVERFGGQFIMTSKHHQSGTDRIAEAIVIIEKDHAPFDIIVNIQGDEPFIYPEQIQSVVSCFEKASTDIATLIKHIINTDDIFNENKPKVIVNQNKEAIYFSRSPIPFIRGKQKNEWVTSHKFYKHIGLYAYRKEVLKQITQIPQSSLEIAESLEQLRWIENGFTIAVEETEFESIGIDTKKDLKRIHETGLL